MVSTTINLNGQDIIIANLYSFIMWFLYAASVYSFLNHYYPSHEDHIRSFISNNNEIVGGLVITTVEVVTIEMLTRTINSVIILWSVNIDNGLGALSAVWLPLGYVFFMAVCFNLYYHIKYLVEVSNENTGSIAESLNLFSKCYDAVVTKFSANINVHVHHSPTDDDNFWTSICGVSSLCSHGRIPNSDDRHTNCSSISVCDGNLFCHHD